MRASLLALFLFAILGLGDCNALRVPIDSPTPSGAATTTAQRLACGRLDPAPCAEVLRAVVARFPEVARAPLVVVDLGKDPKALDPGQDRYLVAFVPADEVDYWMWPPTFQVVRGPSGLIVDPWTSGAPLPGFFVELLRASGVPNL